MSRTDANTITSARMNTLILHHVHDNELPLAKLDQYDFKKLSEEHLSLMQEYGILSAYLQQQLNNTVSLDALKSNLLLRNALINARNIAICLKVLFDKYLGVGREALRYQEDERLFRELLNKSKLENQKDFSDPWIANPFTAQPGNFTKIVREFMAHFNWLRLHLVRIRRLLNATSNNLDKIHPLAVFMSKIEVFAEPIFNHLAWVFFAPRLIVNLRNLGKHLIPGWWMTNLEERNMGWQLRAKAHLARRWAEIANDSVWLTTGALCCFLLLGSLIPVGSYLTAAIYFYDIFLAGLRAYVELKRLAKLKEEYKKSGGDHFALKEHFEQQLQFQRRVFSISISTNIALTIAIALTVPLLMSNPILPLVGAALLITVTIISFIATQINNKTTPTTRVNNTATRLKFFPEQQNSNVAPKTPQENNLSVC